MPEARGETNGGKCKNGLKAYEAGRKNKTHTHTNTKVQSHHTQVQKRSSLSGEEGSRPRVLFLFLVMRFEILSFAVEICTLV